MLTHADTTPEVTDDLQGRMVHVAREHTVVALSAFFTFWIRYFLADKNSYWLDELYSVERYVVQFDSVFEALRDLAGTSIHPPLYQTLLYFWVELFGDRETATRTLSNVFVTASIFFVHRLTARSFGNRVANAATIAYSLAYGLIYYGLETRSYGQSLFFATASSYAVIVYLEQRRSGERAMSTWPGLVSAMLLSGANIGLMLTHYFNFYFLVAQAVFVGIYILTTGGKGSRLRRLAASIVLYLLQLLVFLAVWGRVMVHSYRRNTGRFEADEISFTPLRIIRSVTDQHLSLWRIPTTMALISVGVLLVWVCIRTWRQRLPKGLDEERWTTGVMYLLTITVGAPTVAFLTFNLASAERYAWRYFIFLVPGIIVLFAVATHWILSHGIRLVHERRPSAHQPFLEQIVAVALIVVLLLMVLPDSMRAARNTKDDWRGMAQDMVAVIESDPDSSYIVLEPAFRTTPVYDYYLSRYSDDVRVFATFRRLEERRGHDYSFDRLREEIEVHDYIIIPFVHHRTTNFPTALEILASRYEVEHWQINRTNKGLVIFAIQGTD